METEVHLLDQVTGPLCDVLCGQLEQNPFEIQLGKRAPVCLVFDIKRRFMLLASVNRVSITSFLKDDITSHCRLHQVVPTVERLCAKLRENSGEASCRMAHPMPTEFRWIAIPLGVLVTSGTIVRRRALISRIVLSNLGLHTENDDGAEEACALSKVNETWVAQVLVPALDQVGWHRCEWPIASAVCPIL